MLRNASMWGKRLGRVAGGLAVTAVCVGALSGVAQAKGEYKYWQSASAPLTVTGYGSTGHGYGQWRVADSTSGTRSWLDSNQRLYYNADNHTVYTAFETWTNAGYCYQPEYTSCTQQYFSWASKDTSHYNGSTWKWHYASTDLNPAANYARAHVRMRLDIPWRTDPASGWIFTLGTTY